MIHNTLIYYTLSSFILSLATYLLIIKPQRLLDKKLRILATNLTPGTWVQAHGNISGTIIHIYQHSVLIQKNTGEIVEILKQSIEIIR